jgi:hypothetical protein
VYFGIIVTHDHGQPMLEIKDNYDWQYKSKVLRGGF